MTVSEFAYLVDSYLHIRNAQISLTKSAVGNEEIVKDCLDDDESELRMILENCVPDFLDYDEPVQLLRPLTGPVK